MQLAERRKLENEQVREWMKSSQLDVSDDEKETRRTKKASRPRAKVEADSSDERESKKKKRGGKLKRSANASEDDGALFSGEEEVESKPAVKKVSWLFSLSPCAAQKLTINRSVYQRTKKRVVRDDDEEEATAPRRKQMCVRYWSDHLSLPLTSWV